MVRTTLRFGYIVPLCAFLFAAWTASAQDLGYSMQEMMEMARPGPEHDVLAEFAGDWNVEMKVNMHMKPGGPMVPVKGDGTAKAIMGGRFLEFVTTMDMMGQQSKAMQILGFDRRFDKYTYFAIDEMGTYSISAEGTRDEDTGILTMTGTDRWPMKEGGVKEQVYQMVYTFPEGGRFTFKVLFEDNEGGFYEMVLGEAIRKE